MPAVLFLASS